MPIVSGGLVVTRKALSVPSSGRMGLTLLSDLHVGAAQTDHAAIKRELRAAKARGDRVLVNGDVFDLTLAKDEKHYRPSALHPRLHGKDDIVGEAKAWALDLFEPVGDALDMIGVGNHDDRMAKLHSYDLVRDLVKELRARGSEVSYGGYTGFVDYRLALGPGRRPERFVVFYHHGTGGGSALSGVAGDAAKFSWVEGADVIWLGHKHQPMSVPLARLACPPSGNDCKLRHVRFVRSGAYMHSYTGQGCEDALKNGRRAFYAADGGYAPQAPGGARVKISFPKKESGYKVTVEQ
jgi:hypothetical protein